MTVRAVTPLAPLGADFDARLMQVEVNAATGQATWALSTVQPPQKLRESIAGAVTRLDTAVAAAFHSGGITPTEGDLR